MSSLAACLKYNFVTWSQALWMGRCEARMGLGINFYILNPCFKENSSTLYIWVLFHLNKMLKIILKRWFENYCFT